MKMQKYDIHATEDNYRCALNALEGAAISSSNKDLIQQFIKDAADGCHNPEREGAKPVGKRKLVPYIYYLIKWTKAFGSEWRAIKTENIRRLVADLKDDRIVKTKKSSSPYSEHTKFHMRSLLKLFLRWLAYKHELPIKYGFIDVRHVKTKLPAYLEKDQVEKLSLATSNAMYRALIWLLFDAGLRIEEALNLKMKDVHFVDTPTNNKLMRVDVRISKTEARNPELFFAQEYVQRWLSVHPEKDNPEAYVFIGNVGQPVTYDAVRMYFRKLAAKVLPNVRVYPHLFRHSSATYYASRLNRQQLCLRYGWEFSSNMPDIYIRRSGVDNSAVVKTFEAENLNDLKKQNETLQEQMKVLSAKMAELSEARKDADGLMDDLMTRPEVQDFLVQKIIEKGLAHKLPKS